MSGFIGLATKVNTAVKDLRSGRKLENEDYYNYINLSLDAIDYAFSLVKIFDTRFSTGEYLTLARKSNSLYKDIYTQQYTQAVDDGLSILTQVHNLVKGSTRTIADKNDLLDKLSTFVEKVKPYAIFMANMAQAKTPMK
ncbi:hypothetical protein [Paraflavitalea speifideaquila]|uniref:hypothetical protein n=1 Tax=Paraflavitalea speifideaquila TaxID=3076558 RepID=UPI0028E30094|nr:hypothetical protein [Paraflavitalea speifideiaquila]